MSSYPPVSEPSPHRHGTGARTRVLIADDHAMWRRGLRDVLEPEFEVVGEAVGGQEAIDRTLNSAPDVVVIDLSMPGMGGIEAARHIKQHMPQVGVVMVSVVDADEDIRQAMLAGADGYVLKADGAESIVETVERVARAERPHPPSD